LQSLAYRIWKIAIPILYIGGLCGFTVWQIGFDLEDTDSKIAIGSMLGGFLLSYGITEVVERTWDPEVRHWFKDQVMIYSVSPRILGINPLYIYFAGTNVLLMDNHAIEAQRSSLHRAMILSSWGGYGLAMARELRSTITNRKGDPSSRFPLMLVMNAATTAKFCIEGKVP
jgi:hypothetical protein